MTEEITIRPAKPADLADINAIYNYFVAHLRDVGQKFNQSFDAVYLQLLLAANKNKECKERGKVG